LSEKYPALKSLLVAEGAGSETEMPGAVTSAAVDDVLEALSIELDLIELED